MKTGNHRIENESKKVIDLENHFIYSLFTSKRVYIIFYFYLKILTLYLFAFTEIFKTFDNLII